MKPFKHLYSDINIYEQTKIPDVQSSIYLHEVHIRTVPYSWRYPEHAETMFEINYILEGEQSTKIGGHTMVQLQPSDLILFRPGEVHENRCGSTEGLTYLCIHFDVDDPMFRKLLCSGNQLIFHSSDPNTKRIQVCMKRFIKTCRRSNEHTLLKRMDILSLSIKLFATIAQYMLEDNARIPLASIRSWQLARRAADRFELYLYHLSDQPEKLPCKDIVSTVSNELGISPSYLNRVFHQSFASSPRQYLSSLILNRAKKLLLDEHLTIEEIARRLGYYDLSHFSRQFKRWTGKSPSAYRSPMHSEDGFQE